MSEYIEKEVAVDLIGHELRCGATADQCGLETAFELLCGLPPADVRPVVHGEWVEYDDDYGALCCSVCEKDAPDDTRWPFCPHCGADMRDDNT